MLAPSPQQYQASKARAMTTPDTVVSIDTDNLMLKNSLNVDHSYLNYPWTTCALSGDYCEEVTNKSDPASIRYQDVINFGRYSSNWNQSSPHKSCVMCGSSEHAIPLQNKGVCKICDTSFWFNRKLNVVVKFCKGCKKFSMLDDFQEKPEASKCGRCRYRGRKNYLSKKTTEKENGLCNANNSYDSDSPSNHLFPHTPDTINFVKTTNRTLSLPRVASADFNAGDMMMSMLGERRRREERQQRTSDGRPPIHRIATSSAGIPPVPYNISNLADMFDASTPATKKARLELVDPENSSSRGIATATFNGATYGIDEDGSLESRHRALSYAPQSYAERQQRKQQPITNEYDAASNPLMHLAYITDKMLGAGVLSPLKFAGKQLVLSPQLLKSRPQALVPCEVAAEEQPVTLS